MVVFALVSSRSDRTIDLDLDRADAENTLHEILADEPDLAEVLRIEQLELPGSSYDMN